MGLNILTAIYQWPYPSETIPKAFILKTKQKVQKLPI